jgi:mRNA-degrading endonuclease RelE of RelBE toxin-antitoxin system
MFKIKTTTRFEHDFKHLDNDIRIKVNDLVRTFVNNPNIGKRLHGDLKGYTSLRIGDYRLVYIIDKRI